MPKDCSYGLVFNRKTRTCDWPSNVPECDKDNNQPKFAIKDLITMAKILSTVTSSSGSTVEVAESQTSGLISSSFNATRTPLMQILLNVYINN